MKTLYDIISNNPDYFAWVFGLVNFLWVAFLYFNKKKHDRELETLKHSLNLDLEKRKKIYEMKATQFEKYFRMADDFGKKQQVDLPKRFQPIFDECLRNYLKAEQEGNQEASRGVIAHFSSQIGSIMNEGMEEYLSLKFETNSLKLIASERLASIFAQLKALYEKAFKTSNDFMTKLVELIVSNNQQQIQTYQKLMEEQADAIKEQLSNLMNQMRLELKEI